MMRSRILFLSGHQEDARRLALMLQGLPLALDYVSSLQSARAKLQQEEYDLILTEATLPDGNWLNALHLARESLRELQVIVTDPLADAGFWAEALNLGAYDLLPQPFYAPEVRRILYNACSRLPYEARPMATAV
ncbi:MAG TPA: response regulator [Bryobacteraceae bacterium]|nr:response regulator [Bryobacteraceae bacterium]